MEGLSRVEGDAQRAGVGDKTFSQQSMWRAGESYVARAPGDPLVASLSLWYRDSFFMLLREDTCCDGACALSSTSCLRTRLRLAEETCSDAETVHTNEAVAYLAAEIERLSQRIVEVHRRCPTR